LSAFCACNPAGIAAVVAVILVATFFIRSADRGFSDRSRQDFVVGTKIVMELPALNGFTTDSRPYELTARAAAQDLTKTRSPGAQRISAVVELKDGQRVTTNLSMESTTPKARCCG